MMSNMHILMAAAAVLFGYVVLAYFMGMFPFKTVENNKKGEKREKLKKLIRNGFRNLHNLPILRPKPATHPTASSRTAAAGAARRRSAFSARTSPAAPTPKPV